MDASDKLLQRLSLSSEELVAALTTPEFYVEMLMIGVSVALAFLIAVLVRRRLKIHLKAHPPARLDPEIILRPAALLSPLLAILYLSIIKPFAERYGDGGIWVNAVVQLLFAYIIAKAALMFVKSRPVAYLIAIVVMVLAVLDVTGFMKDTESYLNSMSFGVGSLNLSILQILQGSVILVIVFWIAGAFSRTLETYLRRSSSLSYNARELTVKFFKILVYFIAVMVTLSAMGVDLTAFAVFGGALGVGIGLGLQKITANFVSGITLLLEKSIQIGDLIEMGGIDGHVRQLNIRYALLETFDGREILIPNEELISTKVINWTHSNYLARVEVNVRVAYGSNPKQVIDLMQEAAREHKLCLKNPKPNCFLREFGESSLNFTLYFWIPDVREGRMGPQSDVMMAILDKFQAAGIRISFPQREMHIVSGTSQELENKA
jgi:small-conductance mechanosensitive channel